MNKLELEQHVADFKKMNQTEKKHQMEKTAISISVSHMVTLFGVLFMMVGMGITDISTSIFCLLSGTVFFLIGLIHFGRAETILKEEIKKL